MPDPDYLLQEHPFVAGMSDEHIARLMDCRASLLTFDPDYLITKEGDKAETCFFLEEGDLAVETFVPGEGPRTIYTLHGGEVHGWAWLVPPYRWRFDARTLTQVRAIGVDGDRLREMMQQDHTFGCEITNRLLALLVNRLEATHLVVLDMYSHRVQPST
jgi:CRP-like cAMP-binding protein